MTEMLDRMEDAMATLNGDHDNLLQAIGMIAAAGGITIIPTDSQFTPRPVIMLPQRMYDRLSAIFPPEAQAND